MLLGATTWTTSLTGDVTELTFRPIRQRLELSMQASQCPFSPVISLPSDADRQLQAAIKAEMALFATTGYCGRCLQQAFNYLMTVPATSVEAERAFLAAGILGDNTLDTLCLLRSHYGDIHCLSYA